MTKVCAKFDADLIDISEVTSRKTEWPANLAYPVYSGFLRDSFQNWTLNELLKLGYIYESYRKKESDTVFDQHRTYGSCVPAIR